MGGIFGGGDNDEQTTTVSNSPYPAFKPGLDQLGKDILSTYKAGGLYMKPFPGQTVAPVSPETASAWSAIAQRAQAGSPLTGAAQDFVLSRLDPSYLTQDSPGLKSVIDRSRQGVNAEFSRAGRTFSASHAGGLGASEGNLRYQDFVRRAGEAAQAAQFAPQLAQQDYFDASQLLGVGQQRQGALQDMINAEINRYNALQSGKANELALMSKLLQGGGPGTTSTTAPAQSSGNPFLQLLGGGLSLAGLFA